MGEMASLLSKKSNREISEAVFTLDLTRVQKSTDYILLEKERETIVYMFKLPPMMGTSVSHFSMPSGLVQLVFGLCVWVLFLYSAIASKMSPNDAYPHQDHFEYSGSFVVSYEFRYFYFCKKHHWDFLGKWNQDLKETIFPSLFIEALFTITKIWQQPRYLLTG